MFQPIQGAVYLGGLQCLMTHNYTNKNWIYTKCQLKSVLVFSVHIMHII